MQTQEAHVRRSFHHRLAIAGALVAAAGTGSYAAAGIPAGDPRAPLFIPATLAAVGVAWLMRRTHRALWIGVIGGPVVLVVSALDPFRLLHPDSVVDFVPSLLAVSGSAIAFVGSVIALRERRTGVHDTARPERILLAVGAVAVVLLCVYSASATFARPSTVSVPGRGLAVSVTADEDVWIPRTVSVDTSETTLVLVTNPDWIAHTFVVGDLGVDVYLAPGRERVVTLDAAEAGTYRFECSVTGHEMMTGTLRIS